MQGSLGAGRAIAFLLVGWLGMSCVASLAAVVPMRVLPGLRPGPDVAALVVLFVGLSGRGSVSVVCLLAFALGYLADLSSGAPKGLHMMAMVPLVLAGRLASARLLVRGVIFTALVTGFFGGGYLVLVALMRIGLDLTGAAALSSSAASEVPVWRATLARVPLALLATSLFAPLVFGLLHRVERLFARDPRALGGGTQRPAMMVR